MHAPTVISQRSRRALEGEAGSNVPIRRVAWPDEGRAAGDSDTFTYVSGHTRTCSLYCYLRMAFDLQLELPKWMRSMAQSVPVMVVKEPVSVADRQKKIVNTKTDVNTKRKKNI